LWYIPSHAYIMGFDPYRLGGKPHRLITQLNSKTSEQHCKCEKDWDKWRNE